MHHSDFACPACRHQPLVDETNALRCPGCQSIFSVRAGIPILTPAVALHADVNGRRVTLEEVSATYDKAYTHDGLMGTDLDLIYDRETKRKILEYASPLAGKRMLDVGTGIGKLWDYVDAGAHPYALDVSFSGIARAVQRHPALTASVAVGEHLPHADGFFDIVVAADTLEHTFSPDKALAEIARVLKPGGIFVASFPTPNSLRAWGRNQLTSGRWRSSLPIRLAITMLKRVALFGRPDFQPIDRDLKANEWLSLLTAAGLEPRQRDFWPAPPESPMAFLVGALKR
jgi:ubiquinone/menaquinone biosynthesis C-methylase UbiE